ncbi:CPBP family intramembrane glutamic endopeptidase [Paracoccus tegillarcae]|uniref:CPBP family intramembrane metalloprotease n=1 Tax=Paracoccus tegillarcae TaxID=1529068 RepID=A0A2K9F1Z9_9RHOB|nr:CPBP family intramembrane glutamic endopeptidase [Paracoccus tegillarcae]AUH34392.1 CPBP family intramembrane metalloprotease [Paracoccus tegillarcae]
MATDASVTLRSRSWLWAEFAALYIGAPLAIALFLPPERMFAALFALTLVGLVLLWRTGGFDWRSLIGGWDQINWPFAALFTVGVAAVGYAIMRATEPDYIRELTGPRLRFLFLIWLLYPILSALPQELIFRPLFFHRFGSLFPDGRVAILANAAIFSFAHLMYWSIVVAIMTFLGGLFFARAYQQRGFLSAWLLHALAGNALFAVGMGYYFWSGNVVRPF